MTDIRYPVGEFAPKSSLTMKERLEMITALAELPEMLRKTLDGLSEKQLDTPYRDGGWTPRQIVHHLADSHANASIRCRLALTEDTPTVKPYNQERWAQLIDARIADVRSSMAIITGLHERWVLLWKSLREEQFTTPLYHPEDGIVDLDRILQLYSWHGRHHVAQIEGLRKRMGW